MSTSANYRWLHWPRYLALLSLLASAMLPWNATAIDRSDVSLGAGSNSFSANYIESLLVKSLLEIKQGELQQALNSVNTLLQLVPNFKLAHLVRGDLLMARSKQLQGFGNHEDSGSEALEDLRREARARIEHYLEQQSPPQHLPEAIWQINAEHEYVLLVDSNKSRLYVYRNEAGKLRHVVDYYVTLGRNGSEKFAEGDKRTPIGIYYTSSKLSKKLPDLYGEGAYPLNYPNEWDKQQGKKGYGIWLHGTPSDTYSRPPWASDGCIVMTNQDLKSLAPILSKGNLPVIISHDLQWQRADANTNEARSLQQAVETWRQDWQMQNTDRYLAHYSSRFFSPRADFSRWAQEKRQIQAARPRVEISLSNISMFRYPDKALKMAMVSFEQDYRSNRLQSRIKKRQYWILEDQQWKIMYEGPA